MGLPPPYVALWRLSAGGRCERVVFAWVSWITGLRRGAMADLVEETVRQIRARLKELAPVVAEYERLEAAYAALDGGGRQGARGRGPAGAAPAARRRSAGDGRRRVSQRSRPRAKRGQNKAAVFAVISERPGVTVTEIAAATGIAKPLIYNTTRAGVERGELERVALPGGQSGFKTAAALRDAGTAQA